MIRVEVVQGMGVVTVREPGNPHTHVMALSRPEVDLWIDRLLTLRDDMDRAGPHVAVWPAPDYS